MAITRKIRDSSQFYSGISGLQLPVPKYRFPPEHEDSSRLKYYSTFFNSIEINSSFYKIPLAKTVAKWAAEVPEDFSFTFKLWKEITHQKEILFSETDVEKFMVTINAADGKQGCLLIQFPGSCGNNNVVQLSKLLSSVKKYSLSDELDVAVEFRNISWYCESTYKVLRHFNAAMVIHDKTGSKTPSVDADAKFKYVRFHGPEGNYKGDYPEDFLYEYAAYIHEWKSEGKRVYVYFNNTMGNAFNNLVLLNKMIAEY